MSRSPCRMDEYGMRLCLLIMLPAYSQTWKTRLTMFYFAQKWCLLLWKMCSHSHFKKVTIIHCLHCLHLNTCPKNFVNEWIGWLASRPYMCKVTVRHHQTWLACLVTATPPPSLSCSTDSKTALISAASAADLPRLPEK